MPPFDGSPYNDEYIAWCRDRAYNPASPLVQRWYSRHLEGAESVLEGNTLY